MRFHGQVDYFTHEHMNLVQVIGNQVSAAINNAKLSILIRDQAERFFERSFLGEDILIHATSGKCLGLAIVKQLVTAKLHAVAMRLRSHASLADLEDLFPGKDPTTDPPRTDAPKADLQVISVFLDNLNVSIFSIAGWHVRVVPDCAWTE